MFSPSDMNLLSIAFNDLNNRHSHITHHGIYFNQRHENYCPLQVNIFILKNMYFICTCLEKEMDSYNDIINQTTASNMYTDKNTSI